MIRSVLILVLWVATANASPPSRVLVADSDPELVRAIETSLAPWRIAVIAEPDVPDEAHAHARADAVNAQFIVWREGDQLVVFDREHGTAERRTARADAFDPVSAAAAALTVKTLLRLPLLAGTTGDGTPNGIVIAGPVVPPAPAASGPELRTQIGVGARVARGSQTDLGGRAMLNLLVRPIRQLGFRLGIAGDLGTSSGVSRSGFKGTWSDWAVLGVVSWSWTVGLLEIGPAIGAGVSRSQLEGEIGMMQSVESATLFMFRGGVSVRRPLGRWSIGASLDADVLPATPTYIKNGGMGSNEVFEVPGFSAVVGVFAAADLGR